MENNKIERKDFRPAVRFAEWKIEREAAKREAARRKTIIMNEEKDRIANEQADFEAELRNYIANIPAEERKALSFLEEGGVR